MDQKIGLTVEKFEKETHYEIALPWWRKHDFAPPGPEYLPNTGFMVKANGKPICAGFMYMSNSKFAWLEFVVADPESDPCHRHDALDLLIDTIKCLAKASGFGALYSTLNHKRLIERYQRHGFITTDENVSCLVWRAE